MAAKRSPKNKGGRPSKYSAALVDTICARLATGEPLAQICRDPGFPHPSTVRDWMAARPDVSRDIARAREDGFDAIAIEALRIADECRVGFITETDADGKLVKRKSKDMVERAKLQVETRLKLLAKWDPKRYGEMLKHADAEGEKLEAPQFIIQPVRANG